MPDLAKLARYFIDELCLGAAKAFALAEELLAVARSKEDQLPYPLEPDMAERSGGPRSEDLQVHMRVLAAEVMEARGRGEIVQRGGRKMTVEVAPGYVQVMEEPPQFLVDDPAEFQRVLDILWAALRELTGGAALCEVGALSSNGDLLDWSG